MIAKTAGIGFLIGLVFSLLARAGGLPVDTPMLLAIPPAAAAMSALGTLVSLSASSPPARRARLRTPVAEILGFLSAAVVNTLSVVLLLAFLGQVRLHPGLVLGLILGLGAGALYGLHSYRMSRMEEQLAVLRTLQKKQKQLQEAQRQLALTEERNRMSRELHDSVSQGLQGMLLSLHTLRRRIGEPSAGTARVFDHLELTARTTLDDLRTIITDLSPSLLAEEGLPQALQTQADLFAARNGITVHTDLHPPASLSPARELALYRIVQEALANVEKHADAHSLSLRLSGSQEDHLTLTISDDGRGIDPRQTTEGHGLANMRRRAEDAGGTFRLDTGPLRGTTITVAFGPDEPA